MNEDFIAFSRVLTGERELDSVLSEQYLQRFLSLNPPTDFQVVIERFRQMATAAGGDEKTLIDAVREQIENDLVFRRIAQQIITLWYTGAMKDGSKYAYGSAEQYFSGLLWEVARAHPPALSGGYFGYWKYPPEN